MRERKVAGPFLVAILLAATLPAWGLPLVDAPRAFEAGRGDAHLVRLQGADGRLWAAWTYDAGAETDVAVAVRFLNGSWSEVALLGSADGLNQGHPALAIDARGSIYLAYGVRNGSFVAMAILKTGSGAWSAPVRVSPSGESASRPALRIVGDRLVLSYRTAAGTAILDFPLAAGEGATPQGVQDGPDILPPAGNSSGPPGGGSPISPKR